ncbi:MAG TPA: Gfo/Idh/MocA family oxidoreductase [Pseudonocardiaceae bacterium]|nr:Gfo/Idh/MocA family oxidoreductase [Pseudonocardiaceae bacterium]
MTTPVNLAGHIGVPLDRRPRLAVAGAGARGGKYADLAAANADIVAVAEPRAHHRTAFRARHPQAAVFTDWRDMLAAGRQADAVIIATQDADHIAPAIAFAEAGYDILLEKPMATAEADCARIAAAVERAGVTMAVCHVLRYTPYTRALKSVLDSGRIGQLVAVQHREPVGFWHFAHSFVRGNWRRSDESTFLLLSKSCHDLDWLAHIVGLPAVRVSSFGSLTHFRPESAPVGATDRCVTCPVESTCPYSAPRVYRTGLAAENPKTYFTRVVAPSMTESELTVALAEGPYGRCVYACDNDVVDHQVVNVEYEGGVTASFTLAAFTRMESRHTVLGGTHAEVRGDGRYLRIYDFTTEQTETIDTQGAFVVDDGHDGGDAGLTNAFVQALTDGDPSLILSGAPESLASHRIVFAAERARVTGSVVEV